MIEPFYFVDDWFSAVYTNLNTGAY